MKNELLEDIRDLQDIKKQKEKRERAKEEMTTWEFGIGPLNKKDNNSDVPSQIQ